MSNIKSEIVKTLKQLMGLYTEQPAETVEVTTEETPIQEAEVPAEEIEKFADAPTVVSTGTTEDKIWTDTELKITEMSVGSKVEIVGEEGQLSDAPDGDYEMENGSKFSVKQSLISAIEGEEDPTNETVATDSTINPTGTTEVATEDTTITDLQNKVSNLVNVVEGLVQVIEDLKAKANGAATKDEVNAFGAQVTELNNSIKTLAAVPVQFSQTSNNIAVKDSKEDKMLELARIFSGVRN